MPVMCPNCAQMVADDAIFCDMCGERLRPQAAPPTPAGAIPASGGVCPTCGQSYIPGEIFCSNCGVQLPPVSVGAPAPPAAVPPPPPPPQPIQKPLPEAFVAGRLVVLTTNSNIPIPAGKREVLVGRSDPANPPEPEIDLVPHGGEQAGVSRRHCQLVADAGGTFVIDLKSTNSTFLNRTRLEPGQRYPIRDGDELRLGKLTLIYKSP